MLELKVLWSMDFVPTFLQVVTDWSERVIGKQAKWQSLLDPGFA